MNSRHGPDGFATAGETEDSRVNRELLRYVREASAADNPLPGELDLIARLNCTRQQLRRALSELERQGVLRRRQGAATTVDPVGLRMNVRLEDQFEHTELLELMGYRSEVEIMISRLEPLPGSVATLLDAEPGAPALKMVKRWRADGKPAMLASGYLLMPDASARDLDDSVFTAVTEAWGESLVWEVATPGAAALDEELAGLLEMPVGSAVMTLELIGVGASGRRLFYAFEHHHPEFVTYSLLRTVRPPWAAG